MIPLTNVSVNTLDKAYSVISNVPKKEEISITEEINEEKQSICNSIDFNATLKMADNNEAISSQEELQDVLKSVKANISNTKLLDLHPISKAEDIFALLN